MFKSRLKLTLTMLCIHLTLASSSQANDDVLDADLFSSNHYPSTLDSQLGILAPSDLQISVEASLIKYKNLQSGQQAITEQQIDDLGYKMNPQSLTTTQTTMNLSYGFTSWLTASIAANYLSQQLNSSDDKETNQGTGDTQLLSNIMIYQDNRFENQHSFVINVGASLPTGQIESELNNQYLLGYQSQLGSGTTDAIVGLMYSQIANTWAWGASSSATISTSTNKLNYRLGNRYLSKAWISNMISDSFMLSTGLSYLRANRTTGDNKHYSQQQFSPALNNQSLISRRLSMEFSAFYQLPTSSFQRISLSIHYPLKQDTHTIALTEQGTVSIGWQVNL